MGPCFNNLSLIVHTVWLIRRLTLRPTLGCGAHQEEGVSRRHHSTKTPGLASSRHSSVTSARAPPGSMAPLMSMLFAAQTDIMTL